MVLRIPLILSTQVTQGYATVFRSLSYKTLSDDDEIVSEGKDHTRNDYSVTVNFLSNSSLHSSTEHTLTHTHVPKDTTDVLTHVWFDSASLDYF